MKKLIIIFSLLGVINTSYAEKDRGGANSVEQIFAAAKAELLGVIYYVNPKRISNKNRAILMPVIEQIKAELSSVKFIYDHNSTLPFTHSNGSQTGIQTQIGVPFAPIEIRSKVLLEKTNLDIRSVIMLITHEIGHHLDEQIDHTGDSEQKAWALSAAVLELYSVSVKYPLLVGLSGEYEVIGRNNGCYDKMHAQSDSMKGLVTLSVYSSSCSNNDLMSFEVDILLRTSRKDNSYLVKLESEAWLANPNRRPLATILPDGGVYLKLPIRNKSEIGGVVDFTSKFVKIK